MLFSMYLMICALDPVPFPHDGLEGKALAAHIQKKIDQQGGTPVVDGTVFHFFYQAKDGETPKIMGDFDRWRRGRNPQATPMTPLAEGWYHFGVAVKPRTRIEYLIEVAGTQGLDPRNPRQVTTWYGPISVAQMPDYPEQPELMQRDGIPRGHVASFRFNSKMRHNERWVHVYTPPGYENSAGKLPTLFFGDGSGYVKTGHTPTLLDNMIADQTIPPVIAVFIDPVDRWLEYRMYAGYRIMLLNELFPQLYEKWRIDPKRQIIIGSSRGGLSALDLTATYPDRFIGCLALAPAATESDFTLQLRRIQGDARPHIRILTGTYDFWLPDSREIFAIMKEKGYRVHFREEPVGHSIHAWQGFLNEELAAFFKPE